MRTVINDNFISVEEHNELMAQGYKFYVKGDYRTNGHTDPWSGMPEVDNSLYYFDNEEEAEEYAKTVVWPFTGDVVGRVYKVVRRETLEERKARELREKTEKAEAKARKEAEKAEAMGLTVEEYNEYKKAKTSAKRRATEIRNAEEEIEALRRHINYLLKDKAKNEEIIKKYEK